MKLRTKLLFAAPAVLLLLLVGTGAPVRAWDYGPGNGCGWNGCGPSQGSCDFSCHNGLSDEQIVSQASESCGAYCEGEQDAIFDYNHNMQYQPECNCLPCHSSEYWNSFRQGYDSCWQSHQEQSQGASININGDNNYVSVNQNQQQNPLQQIAHTVGGFINCGGQVGDGGP